MGKIVFVGKSSLSWLYRSLGFEVKFVEEDIPDLSAYEVILTERDLFEKLKNLYSSKMVIPLVDFFQEEDTVISRIKRFITNTVGQEVLRK